MSRAGPPTEGTPMPWERQSEESWPAYEAFQIYLRLGGQRSVRAVARELKKATRTLEAWCQINEWPRRVDAWDRWLNERAREAAGEEAAKAVARHLKEVQALQNIKTSYINEFVRRTKEDPAWMSKLEPWQFARLTIALSRSLATDVDVERQALGLRDPGPEEAAGAGLKDGKPLVIRAWRPTEEELRRLAERRPAP